MALKAANPWSCADRRRRLAILAVSASTLCLCHSTRTLAQSPKPSACARAEQEAREVLAKADALDEEGSPQGRAELHDLLGIFRRCLPTQGGAWTIPLRSIEGGPGRWKGHWVIAHLGLDGRRVEVFPTVFGSHTGSNFSFATSETLRFREPVLFDFDGDGEAELFVGYSSLTEFGQRYSEGHLWGFKEGKLEPYTPARDISIEELTDFDGDGRPDLITVGPYFTDQVIACEDPGLGGHTVTGPRLLAHSLRNGTFSMTDEVATTAAKKACPAPPTILVPGRHVDDEQLAVNVVCARLWGMSTRAVVRQLHEAFGAAPPFACDNPAALVHWAELPPPLTLRETPTQKSPARSGARGTHR